MKNAALGAIIIATMSACSSTKKFNKVEYDKFKAITADVCLSNLHEVKLAQHLYIEMRNNQKSKLWQRKKKK